MSKTGFYKGRLGIGLTSTMGMGDGNPRYPLDINGDIRLTGAIVNSQGLALNMVNPDSAWAVDAANNKISYSAGNVGIGTTSPTTLLEIKGDGDADNNQIIIQNESYDKGILFKYKSATGTTYDFNQARIWTSQHGAYDTKLHFSTAKNVPPSTTPPLNEAMTIDADGNVGIGTQTPNSLLHIFTNESISSTSTTNKTMLTIESDVPGDCGVNNFNPISIDFVMGDNQDPKGIARIGSLMCPTGLNHGDMNHEAATALTFSTQGAASGSIPEERMRINHAGLVGIGTTSPQSGLDIHKMHVETGLYESDGITFTTESPQTHLSGTFWSLGYIGGYHLANNGAANGYPGGIVFKTKPANSTADYNLTTRMVIDAAGNVGIGTTSAHEKLVVHTASAQTKVQFGIGGNDYSTVMYIGGAGGNQRKLALISEPQGGWCRSNLHFCLNTAGDYSDATKENDSKMVIKNNGNVGIGTTSPDDKLHVQGGGIHVYCNSAGTGSDAAQGSSAGNANIFMDCNNYSTGAKNGIIWKSKYNLSPNTYTKTSAGIYYQPEGNYIRGGLVFYTNGTSNESTDATEKMRINMNGNVGIGTTTPYAMLDINRNNDGLPLWLRKSTTDTNPGNITRYYAWIGGGEGVLNMKQLIGFGFAGYSTAYSAAAYIGYQRTTHGNHHSGDLIFGTRATQGPGDIPTERMRIAANGNVGIGTLTPSAKLDVYGSIKARGIDGGNIGSKFLVTPVTDGTHNLNNVPSLTGAGNWLEYHPHVDFDFILKFDSPYQWSMQIYLYDKQGNIIQQVGMGLGSTTASSGTDDPGSEGNNVALFVYNPEKKMYEFAYSEYWYNWGNNSTDKAAFNEVIDQALPTDMIVLNGTGYCSRWMEYSDQTERLRRHFGSTESPYTAGWSSVQFAGIKGYGKILEFDTGSRGTQRAAAVKIGDIHKWDDIDYSVAWTSDGTPNRSEAQALTSSDFCFMYNKYGGRIAKMKIHAVSNSDRCYVTLADGGSGQTSFSIDNNYAFIWPSKVKMAVEQAGGTWPSGAGTYGGWITMQGGQASYYWTADDGNNYYFAFGNKHAGRRRYMVNGTRNRRDDAWPVGSTRGTNVEIRDTHLTIKKRTDKYDYGNQTRMIEFKPYMSDRWNNSGSEFQPYTVKASINSGISSLRSSLNTETGFIAFHTADGGILDERMRIEYNGHVGIGTTVPNSALCVNGSLTTVNGAIQIVCKSENYDHDAIMCKAAVNSNHIINFVNTSNSIRGLIRGNGTSGVTYETSSDRRLKENVIGMSNMIDKIMSIKCREFDWIQDKKHDFGFIAQEIYELFPHLRPDVSTYCDCSDNCFDKDEPKDKDGNPYYYGLDYGEFTPYLVKAFQELYEKEQEDKAEIAELKTEVATLKSELAAIKQHLGI